MARSMLLDQLTSVQLPLQIIVTKMKSLALKFWFTGTFTGPAFGIVILLSTKMM